MTTFDEIRKRIELLDDLSPRLVYTRRLDRVLATVWPPARRRRRQMQRLVDWNADRINDVYWKTLSDLALYGTSITKVQPKDD